MTTTNCMWLFPAFLLVVLSGLLLIGQRAFIQGGKRILSFCAIVRKNGRCHLLSGLCGFIINNGLNNFVLSVKRSRPATILYAFAICCTKRSVTHWQKAAF